MTPALLEHIAAFCRDIAQVFIGVMVITPLVSGKMDSWMWVTGLATSLGFLAFSTYLVKRYSPWMSS